MRFSLNVKLGAAFAVTPKSKDALRNALLNGASRIARSIRRGGYQLKMAEVPDDLDASFTRQSVAVPGCG